MRNKKWSNFEERELVHFLYDRKLSIKEIAKTIERSYDSVKHKAKEICHEHRILVFGDLHAPYCDQRAKEIMIEIGIDFNPHEVVSLGDFADMYSVTLHQKSPSMTNVLLDDIRAVNKELDVFSLAFPDAKKVFLEGNHENRLGRYIASKAPELFNMLDIPSLFRLKEHGFEYVKYGPNQLYVPVTSAGTLAKFGMRHEPLSGGVGAARISVLKAMESLFYAHNHRLEEYHTKTILGRSVFGTSFGWLGQEGHKAFEYVKNPHTWQHGFGLVWLLPNGECIHKSMHIKDGMCTYNGKIYK